MQAQLFKRNEARRTYDGQSIYPVIDVQLQAFMYFWSDVFLRVFFFSKVSPPRHHQPENDVKPEVKGVCQSQAMPRQQEQKCQSTDGSDS